MIETNSERESMKPVLIARHDDDEDDIYIYIYIYILYLSLYNLSGLMCHETPINQALEHEL